MNKLLLGMAMAVVASSAFAQGKLTGVEWAKVGTGLKVQIKGEGLGQPKVIRAWGGKSYLLEFSASLVGRPQMEQVDFAGVDFVQTTWFTAKPAKVRVHLRIDPNAEVELEKDKSGVYVLTVAGEATKTQLPEAKGTGSTVKLVGGVLPAIVPPPVAKPDGLSAPEPKKADPKVNQPKTAPARVNKPLETPNFTQSRPPVRGSIDLEFINTDVVQVLRAIAMEGDVNIVTASDVQGTITVSLTNVSVVEALNLVTAMAGLSYARMGSTYVVASDPSRLRAFGQIDGKQDTRVVPIFSGEARQVKAAVMRSMPLDGNTGPFEIVLPSEAGLASKPAGTGAAGTAGATGGTQAPSTGGDIKSGPDGYVVLIASGGRLDELESMVRRVDSQICQALGKEVPESTEPVRRTYFARSNKAAFLLASVMPEVKPGATTAKIGNVEVFATPLTSVGEQSITLAGPEHEVEKLMRIIESMDQVSDGGGDFMIYDVRFMDPRGLKQDLESQFPGISVSLIASAAGNPGLFKEVSSEQSAGGGGQSSSQTSQSTSGDATIAGESAKFDGGIQLPFANLEKQAYGMRLRLRGSKDNLERAMAYLSQVDTAPKQVALELRVMDISREDGLKLGIDWGMLMGNGTTSIFRINQGTGDPASSAGVLSGQGAIGGRFANVTATLDEIANDRNLIARPNLFAFDGRQSELFVGDVIRYVESIQSTQSGTTVTSKELPVGVRLAVLPRIGGDGQITMDVRPVVSTLNGFISVPGGGQLPQTSLRIAQNTLTIQDGETIAIGGLIQETDVKRQGGIPILKDLPIIGKLLFSRTDNSKRRTEMVFFLTARIVDRTNRGDAANPGRDGTGKWLKPGAGTGQTTTSTNGGGN